LAWFLSEMLHPARAKRPTKEIIGGDRTFLEGKAQA